MENEHPESETRWAGTTIGGVNNVFELDRVGYGASTVIYTSMGRIGMNNRARYEF